jgi:hypothetical protein
LALHFWIKTPHQAVFVQDGQAASSEVISVIPLANWISKALSHLSYSWLGAPRALEFKIMPSGRQDPEALARANDIKLKNGTLTRNEARSKEGLPLLNSPVADQPTIYTGTDILAITEGFKHHRTTAKLTFSDCS